MSVQSKLLHCLVDGRFHSGEQLAKQLDVTRAAVWKHIKKLQTDFQLDIHAVTGKGYRLSQAIELLDAKKILSLLNIDSSDLQVETFLSIDSTNRYLMKKETNEAQPISIVFAEQQTAGRGRQGRTWVSPFGGNLYFSILYRFDSAVTAISGLSLAIGVAIVEYLESIGLESARLKWPNDILVDGRKLCGILLEMHGESYGPSVVVIGVGLNVRMPESSSDLIDQPWTALSNELGNELASDIPRNKLAAGLFSKIMPALNEFGAQGLIPFKERWTKWDAYKDSEVTLSLGERKISGIARGIDQQGALLIEHNNQLERYYSGEIKLRPARNKTAKG